MFAQIFSAIENQRRQESDPKLGIIYSFLRVSFCLVFLIENRDRLCFYSLTPARACFGIFELIMVSLLLGGIYSRLTALVAGASYIYMTFAWGYFGGNMAFRHQHSFLLGFVILLIGFVESDSHLSLAKYWPLPPINKIALTLPVLTLFRIQVVIIYVFALISKFNGPFLSGFALEQQFIFNWPKNEIHYLFGLSELFQPLAVLVILTELTLILLLAFPQRTCNKAGVILGIAFHSLIFIIFPVGSLSFIMALLLLCFLDPLGLAGFLDQYLNGARKQIENHG